MDVLHDSLCGPPVQPPGEQLIPSWHVSAMTALEFHQLPANQHLFSVNVGTFQRMPVPPLPLLPPPRLAPSSRGLWGLPFAPAWALTLLARYRPP